MDLEYDGEIGKEGGFECVSECVCVSVSVMVL